MALKADISCVSVKVLCLPLIAADYPEPAFVCAEVGLGLLFPLPPLYQAGGVVSRQADVTAAGRGG